MLRIISILFLGCVFTSHFSKAQCNDDSEQRVLLVGDSWAFFMGVDQTINNVLSDWGHSNKTYFTNATLAENGARVTDFLEPDKQNEIAAQLQDKPSIDYVHLSIGGNDVLGDWKVSFTTQQTDSLKQVVLDDLLEVIDFIKSVRPGIKILWSGYVYPNFQEVIEDFISPSNHPFHGTWSGMEFPDNESINQILVDFSGEIEVALANDPQVEFISVPGLMQYTFGQNDALGVAPFGTYPAFEAPLPNGYVDYPSPVNSMRDYALTKDCFHLSAQGYYDLISYHTQKYYHKELMNDRYFLAQGDSKSATIGSDGIVEEELFIGENNMVENHTVLHFELDNLPDTAISKASIFLHQQTETGGNPFEGTVRVRIKENYFGDNVNVDVDDLNDLATAEGEACVFGSTGEGNWVRLDLPAEILSVIQNQSAVSFILSAEGNGLVQLSGTADEEFAPVLDLTFQEADASIEEHSVDVNSVSLYPNPMTDALNIDSEESVSFIRIFDMQGKEVLHESNTATIDVNKCKPGVYFVHVHTKVGHSVHKVIKK